MEKFGCYNCKENFPKISYKWKPHADTVFEIMSKKYIDVIEILVKFKATIFGGFIRDIFAGVQPNDLDCCVFEQDIPKIMEELGKLGYSFDSDKKIAICEGKLPIEFVTFDFEEDGDCILTPCCDPDIDINTLAYLVINGKYSIECWYDLGIDPCYLMQRCKKRIFSKLECSTERYEKMQKNLNFEEE